MSLLNIVLPLLVLYAAASAVSSPFMFWDHGVKGLRSHAPISRNNVILSVGSLGPEDEQFHNRTDVVNAVANRTVSRMVTFENYFYGKIRYILVTELGESQNVTASIIRGGLETSAVTIVYQSEESLGINVLTQIYGHV